MNTKKLFKNLAILLFFSIGFFSIYSFTTTDADSNDLTTYDQSYYQDIDSNDMHFSFADVTTDNEKCGGDNKAKDTKDADKDSKCGGEVAKDSTVTKDAKCGDGKSGDDKKADEGKDAKCGAGKCG